MDRVEATLDRFVEETTRFQTVVRGAITAQQELIEENRRQIAETDRLVREVAKLTYGNSRNWEQLRREFEA